MLFSGAPSMVTVKSEASVWLLPKVAELTLIFVHTLWTCEEYTDSYYMLSTALCDRCLITLFLFDWIIKANGRWHDNEYFMDYICSGTCWSGGAHLNGIAQLNTPSMCSIYVQNVSLRFLSICYAPVLPSYSDPPWPSASCHWSLITCNIILCSSLN